MEKVEIRQKEELGQIFTPPIIAKLMAELLLMSNPKNILDPAVGSGALLMAVSDIDPERLLSGFDIDSEWIEDLRSSNFNVVVKDFFDYTEKTEGIIMNPPYIRQEKLIENEIFSIDKKRLSDQLSKFKLSSQSNLYLYFFAKALLSLDKNGVLVSIMPNTWLSSAYGKTIQKVILTEYKIEKIIHFDKNIFKDFDVDVSIFVIINSKPENNSMEIFDVNSDLRESDIENIVKGLSNSNIEFHEVLQKDIELSQWFKYRENIEFSSNNFVSLSKRLHVSRGTTTNSNAFFILDKENSLVQTNNNLFKPILNKAIEVNGLEVDQTLLKKVVFSTKFNKDELPTDIVSYIKKFEESVLKEGLPKTLFGKIVKEPNTWFNLFTRTTESIVLNYYIRNEARFIISRDDIAIKDNFYRMIPKNESEFKYYLGVLNSSFTKYFLEVSGRSYGSGLLKIQKYELDSVPIVPFENVDKKDRLAIEKLVSKMLNNPFVIESKLSEVDNILANYYLNEKREKKAFYKLYRSTINKRKGEKND